MSEPLEPTDHTIVTMPLSVARLVADPKTHRARRRELSLRLMRDEAPQGQRLPKRPGHKP